jgi:hypothetical protein
MTRHAPPELGLTGCPGQVRVPRAARGEKSLRRNPAAGVVVGYSYFSNNTYRATEWSGGSVIDLNPTNPLLQSEALGINNAGQVVGWASSSTPEPSIWAMMLIGFAGYRRAIAGRATLAT